MTYLGDPVTQLDGSTYQHSNCAAAGGDELANCSSLGFWQPKPAAIRVKTGDTVGGLDYPEVAAAIKAMTGGEVVLTPLYWAAPATLDDVLDAPRVTGISILCSVTVNTPYHTGTYTGRHFVVVGAKRSVTVARADGSTYLQKQAYVMDPGKGPAYVKWQWWPWSLLMKAAMASTGNGTIHLMYTRDLGGVSRTTKSAGSIWSKPVGGSQIATIAGGVAVTVLGTVKGDGYSANGHTAYGWSHIGKGYVKGLRLR